MRASKSIGQKTSSSFVNKFEFKTKERFSSNCCVKAKENPEFKMISANVHKSSFNKADLENVDEVPFLVEEIESSFEDRISFL